MPTWRLGTLLAALVAAFVWRNGRIASVLLLPPSLPPSFFSGGDAATHCSLKAAQGLSSCEDIISWRVPGLAQRVIASCDPGRKNWNTVMGPLRDPEPRGGLFVVSDDNQPVAVRLKGYPDDYDFHPLGLAVFPRAPPLPSILYAVNHARNRSSVEVFHLDSTTLAAHHVRTLAAPSIISPNAIALTGPDSFYLSQDHRFTRRLPSLLGKTLPLAESLLAVPLGWVSHLTLGEGDAFDISIAASNIPFPNGVSLSEDGTRLAVVSSSQGLYLYDRNTEGKLQFAELVMLPFAGDNVEHADDGSMIIGGHPDFRALSAVAAGKRENAPSWVLKVSPGLTSNEVDEAPCPVSSKAPKSTTHDVKTLYQSDGIGGFSASTTGIWEPQSKTLFVSGLYTEGILICKA